MSGNVEVACGHLKYSHLPKVFGKSEIGSHVSAVRGPQLVDEGTGRGLCGAVG